jgi:hypothetical protein
MMTELTLKNLNAAAQAMRQSQADEMGVPVDQLDWEIAVRQGPQAWFERTGEIVSLEQYRKMLDRSFDLMREFVETPSGLPASEHFKVDESPDATGAIFND